MGAVRKGVFASNVKYHQLDDSFWYILSFMDK